MPDVSAESVSQTSADTSQSKEGRSIGSPSRRPGCADGKREHSSKGFAFITGKSGRAITARCWSRFHYGRKAYYVGGHPLWETLRGLFQIKEPPRFFGGLYFIAGYWWACLTRMHRPVSRELIAFHRGEQMARLRGLFRRSPKSAPEHRRVHRVRQKRLRLTAMTSDRQPTSPRMRQPPAASHLRLHLHLQTSGAASASDRGAGQQKAGMLSHSRLWWRTTMPPVRLNPLVSASPGVPVQDCILQ